MLREKLEIEGWTFKDVAGPYFAYLFRRINQRQFVTHMGDKVLARKLLNNLKYDGYVLKNCKLYAWAWWRSRHGDPRPDYKQYGITLADAQFLRRLNLDHLKLKNASYSPSEFNALLKSMLNSSAMQAHIGKLISKKMSFLIRSYGVTRLDLENELRGEALRAVYKQYPKFHSELHMINTAKTTIHNTAMSAITYHTCPARQRLCKDANGHDQAVHEDLALVHNTIAAPQGYMTHIKDQLITIVNLSPKMRPEVQGFLTVLAGHQDRGFTEFLGQDNTIAVDRMAYPKYMGKAAEYYGLSEKRVDHIFSLLRRHLQ